MTQTPIAGRNDGNENQRVVEVTSPVSVLWWRDARAGSEVPRSYGVGWMCADGSVTGLAALTTPHAWLDAATIEAGIQPVLTAELGPVSLAPAAGQTSPIVDLAVAGHRLHHADLALTYGVDVVGGVVAELRGRGVQATVVFDRTLSTPLRLAVACWAVDALHSFRHSSEGDLLDQGWHPLRNTSWQLLASQPW